MMIGLGSAAAHTVTTTDRTVGVTTHMTHTGVTRTRTRGHHSTVCLYVSVVCMCEWVERRGESAERKENAKKRTKIMANKIRPAHTSETRVSDQWCPLSVLLFECDLFSSL